LHSVELNFQRKEPPAYLVEWVDNLPKNSILPDLIEYKTVKQSTEMICPAENPLTISGSETTDRHSRAAMRLVVAGVELYLVKLGRRGKKCRRGRIVYRSCPDQQFRDKVRDCLSFVLGLPIVCYGHTEFCTDWIPTKAQSVAAFSVRGAMFGLHEQPPFPINDASLGWMLNSRAVEVMVNELFQRYDTLGFQGVSWSYWHAMCAPVHNAAAQFGAVIEQFQRAPSDTIRASRKGMLADDSWKILRSTIRAALDTTDMPADVKTILKSKVDNLNQAPQGVVLNRLLDGLGLRLGNVEKQAWTHRNKAAHGHLSRDHIAVILNAKVLRVLFHRMLGGVTRCSDTYIDYYNLNFPVRSLAEPIPVRT